MIIVKLKGGLGNQMFQYAMGRHVAHRLQVHLKLDRTKFADQILRSYGLGAFRIQENIATPKEINDIAYCEPNVWHQIRNRLKKKPANASKNYVIETSIPFSPHSLTLPDQTYLEGYWQSEKYFRDISSIIRNEFSFKFPADPLNQQYIRSDEEL